MLEKFHETNVGKVFWSKLSLAFINTKVLKNSWWKKGREHE